MVSRTCRNKGAEVKEPLLGSGGTSRATDTQHNKKYTA